MDITLTKIEAIKNMLDPKAESEGQTSQFDDLIEMVTSYRDIIEGMKTDREEDAEDYLVSEDDDDLPRYYYGEDEEIIFEDD